MRFHFPLCVALTVLPAFAQPTLPTGVTNTQKGASAPLPPAEALAKIMLPEGFRATLFAGEPEVMQPIAFDFDDRGRLWVVENFSYPDFKKENADRVVILEDADGDGRAESRKVVLEGGHRLSGIAWGHGGIWLTASPELIFVPIGAEDRPYGPPVVKLDGFTLKAGHNMVNGLAWGPDGWLYGRHGITTSSLVGTPGTPEDKRVKINCSIWRFHPRRNVFEVVTHGTTNPWGHDWDEHGQLFFSNNVIGHFWHAVPGARYKRMFGEDFNPHTYHLLEQTADHLHWAGTNWTASRGGAGEHDALGGGHSHCGLTIYLGDNFPAAWRGRAIFGNIHGNRVLFDTVERSGSGYVARHGGDVLRANDPWFRTVTQSYGPDGGLFVSDWNDLGECHDNDGALRTSGRIYKVTHGAPKPVRGDLSAMNDAALVDLQTHANEWFVRHARRLLQERADAGRLAPGTRAALEKLTGVADPVRRLRGLWALHATGGAGEKFLLKLLAVDKSEHVRWWCVQLLVEERAPSPAVLATFLHLAREDKSALVRLSLASALQRMPLESRWDIATAVASREEDAGDAWLPLMVWYGIEPAVPADRARALKLMAAAKFPLLRQCITRRLAN